MVIRTFHVVFICAIDWAAAASILCFWFKEIVCCRAGVAPGVAELAWRRVSRALACCSSVCHTWEKRSRSLHHLSSEVHYGRGGGGLGCVCWKAAYPKPKHKRQLAVYLSVAHLSRARVPADVFGCFRLVHGAATRKEHRRHAVFTLFLLPASGV